MEKALTPQSFSSLLLPRLKRFEFISLLGEPRTQAYWGLPLVFMDSSILKSYSTTVHVPGVACAIHLPVLWQGVSSWKYFANPRSPLVSQKEIEILFLMIWRQVSGFWPCSCQWDVYSSGWWGLWSQQRQWHCPSCHSSGVVVMLQGPPSHACSRGMARSWNSVTWGASGSVLVGAVGGRALFPEAEMRGSV